MVGFTKSKVRIKSELGINILVQVDLLRVKLVKLVNANNAPLKMSLYDGTESTERLTQDVRRVDALSFKTLMILCFEPSRKEVFFKAVDLLIKAKNLEVNLCKRFSTTDDQELNEFWIEFINLEKSFHSLYGSDVYIQAVSKPFVEPSPKQIVQLFNRLLSVKEMYTSAIPLPEWTPAFSERYPNPATGFVLGEHTD